MSAALARRRHSPSVGAVEPFAVELRLATAVWPILDGLEQRHPPSLGQPGTLDVFGEVTLQRVMAGHLVELAALFVEPHPEPALLVEDVAHVHSAGRGDEGKGEDHHSNQCSIPQPSASGRYGGRCALAPCLVQEREALGLAHTWLLILGASAVSSRHNRASISRS